MRFLSASGQTISATDNSNAAGRDVVVHNYGPSKEQTRLIVEQTVAEISGRPAARIRPPNNKRLKLEDMNEFTNRVSAFSFVQSTENRSKFRDYAAEHIRQGELSNMIGRTFIGVDQALKKKEFKRAHKLLKRLIPINELANEKDDIVENYLISGYIEYANSGNTTGMLALIAEAEVNYFGSIHEGIEYLLIEVQQEIATRQKNDALLQDNERLLIDFLNRNMIDPQQSGLLGLLYRRIGERGSINHLRMSEDIFRSILRNRNRLNVEEANNFGIALIRDFELTNDMIKLDEALTILQSIDFSQKDYPLPDYLSLPKAINNIGNAYKQKMKFTGIQEFYTQAIESYTRAEQYWTESSAPYEWAMLQKNKAETRLEYYNITQSRSAIEAAAAEINLSLKHRTEKQSPYQHARSLEVKEKIDKALLFLTSL